MRCMERALRAIMFGLLLQSAANGQAPPANEVIHLDIRGLPSAPIRCLEKDHDGFLWIGTENGLCRYDGINVDVYRNIPGDSTSLPGNYVLDMVRDARGKLWVAVFGGVSMFDPRTFTCERKALFKNGERIPSYEAVDLFLDREGGIWSACVASGLAKYDAATGMFHQVEAAQANMPIRAAQPNTLGVLRDAEGTIWATDRMALVRYDPASGSAQRIPFDPVGRGPRDRVHLTHVRQDPNDANILWLGSWGLGMVRFDKRTHVFTNTLLTTGGVVELTNIVWSLTPGEDGRWLVGIDKDLRWFDPRTSTFSATVRTHQYKTGAFEAFAYAQSEEADGRIWIGSTDGLFTLPPRPTGLRTFPARGQRWCVAVDRPGYWAVRHYARRTLFKIGADGELLDSIPLPNADVERYEPFSILQRSDGHVWIGTTMGLVIYDPARRSFKREALASVPRFKDQVPDIAAIIEQADRSLWFASHDDGVISYRPDDGNFTFHAFDHSGGSPQHFCESITVVDKDHIAMIYANEGMGVMDTRTTRSVELTTRDTAGQGLQEIVALVVHGNGIIHAVLQSAGVVVLKYDGVRLIRVAAYRDAQDPNNVFNEAAGDASGNTWIATNTGLVKFIATDGTFQHFGPVNGFPLSAIGSIMADRGDRINAYHHERVRFDPKTLTATAEASGLYIRSIAVNGAKTGATAMDAAQAPLRLAHDRNSVTIEYAAIALVRGEELRYEVRLEGHENGWVDNGANRTVSYIGLRPGRYVFHARIAGDDNSAVQARFPFTIVPAWWQTWWFTVLLVLLSGGAVFFLSRYVLHLRYQKRIAALEREREIGAMRTRIARDIHDDIGSGLTRITMLSREMNSPQEIGTDKDRLAGSIASASKELIGQLSEIVWTVDPKNDHAGDFIAHVRHMLGRQFEELSIGLRTDLTIEAGQELRAIPPDVKRNVVLILKETVSNALKHAQARTISVKLRIGADELTLRVEDDGRGFEPSSKNGGNGLGNIRKRSEAIGGTLDVRSDESGTRYELRVPLNSNNHG